VLMAAYIEFDYAIFQKEIPKYSTLPEAFVQQFWDLAVLYMSNNATYGWLTGSRRQLGLNLLTAHLIYCQVPIDIGENFFVDISATIDKITVNGVAPPSPDNYTWQLNVSPYGQMFLFLMKSYNAGGWGININRYNYNNFIGNPK